MNQETLSKAAKALEARLHGHLDGRAKFVIEGVGAIMIEGAQVRISDEPADVTLRAALDVFEAIFEGGLSPASAFMSGKLLAEGDIPLAMRLGGVLA